MWSFHAFPFWLHLAAAAGVKREPVSNTLSYEPENHQMLAAVHMGGSIPPIYALEHHHHHHNHQRFQGQSAAAAAAAAAAVAVATANESSQAPSAQACGRPFQHEIKMIREQHQVGFHPANFNQESYACFREDFPSCKLPKAVQFQSKSRKILIGFRL